MLKLLLEGEAVRTEAMASVLGVTEAEIEATLAKLEEEEMLLGWRPVVNPKAVADHEVQALIEVSIVPEREGGFNRIADRIARFHQVVTCYLMSGGYDLLVVVRGRNLLEVATFVSEKLATLGPVKATATRFMLQCYKIDGFMINVGEGESDRLPVSP
ncbi:MAG: Lrp/AsnC family transcriptional regulator [Opitutales bacterium]